MPPVDPSTARRAIPLVVVMLVALLVLALSQDAKDAREAQDETGAAGPLSAHTAPRLPWGLYQIYWSRDFGDRLATTLQALAERPDYVMFYRDLGRDFPRHGIDAIHALGAVPIISLELGSWHRPDERFLPRIVAGDLDEFFTDWAEDALSDGRRVLLRFGFEANGDWFSWGGQPAAYVAAWRHVHALFEAVGAHNVEWVWSPNVVSIPRDPENSLQRYFPGEEVVDWLGLDGYNFGDTHDEWHEWESFQQIFAQVVADLARRHPGKPIMIAETGSAPGAPGEPGRKAQWIRDAYESVRAMPAVKALIWFNLDKRREGEQDWRIDSSDDSLAAFNETFATAREPVDPSAASAEGPVR